MYRSRSLAVFALATIPLVGVAAAAEETESSASAAVGRATYRVFCASCHGLRAKGDGSVAEHLKVPPADLTRIAARNDGEFPAEEVRAIIDGREEARGHGTRDMPVWGDAFLKTANVEDEEDVRRKIDDLVAFLASIQEP